VSPPGVVEAFAIVFEYQVSPDRASAFERVYGSDGDWARFFAEDPEYRGTELWTSLRDVERYVVVDCWDSEAAYADFRNRNANEYERRSAASASLYEAERVVGEFHRGR
jgi:heme-degrading monooxygenase HmoA